MSCSRSAATLAFLLLAGSAILAVPLRSEVADDLSTLARQALAVRLGPGFCQSKVGYSFAGITSNAVSEVWQPALNQVVPPGEWWDQTGSSLTTVYGYWLGEGAKLAALKLTPQQNREYERAKAMLYRKREPAALLRGMTSLEPRPNMIRYFLSLNQALEVFLSEESLGNSDMPATSLLEAAANEPDIREALAVTGRYAMMSPQMRQAHYASKANPVLMDVRSELMTFSQAPEEWPAGPGWSVVALILPGEKRVELEIKQVKITRDWFKPEYFGENFWTPADNVPAALISSAQAGNVISQTLPSFITEIVFARNLKLVGTWSETDIASLDGWLRPVSPDIMLIGVIAQKLDRQPKPMPPYFP